MQCVISLTIQYMAVYTALALCRTAMDLFNLKYENLPIQDILKTATLTVNFAPMLAVLFLACRMRVTWLTQGKGNPQEYVQVAMYCSTYAVLAMTLCVCVIPIFTGKVMAVDPKTGDIPMDEKLFANYYVAGAFTLLKYLIMLGLYAGALVVVYGIINFVPMLAVLFIGARMRALQMDPVNGAPQKWAQNCFFMCTYALMAQTILCVAVTLVLSGTSEPNPKVEGDMTFKVENKALGAILSVGRYLIMFCIYVGFTCVIYSIFTIQHPKGDQYTPPISVTMQCVINLTFQFFFIYLMIWICVTIKEFTGYEWKLLINTMENLKGTVAYCP